MSIKLGNSTKDAEKLWFVDNAGVRNSVLSAWYVDDALARHLIFAASLPVGNYTCMAYNPLRNDYLILDATAQVIRAVSATNLIWTPERDIARSDTTWGSANTALSIQYGGVSNIDAGPPRVVETGLTVLTNASTLRVRILRVGMVNYGTVGRSENERRISGDIGPVIIQSYDERGEIRTISQGAFPQFRRPLGIWAPGRNVGQRPNQDPTDMLNMPGRDLFFVADKASKTLFAYDRRGRAYARLNQDLTTASAGDLGGAAEVTGDDVNDKVKIVDGNIVEDFDLVVTNQLPHVPALTASTTELSAVTNLTATRDATRNRVTVSWTASAGATGYQSEWYSPYGYSGVTSSLTQHTTTSFRVDNAGWGQWLIIVRPTKTAVVGPEARITPTFTADPVVAAPDATNDFMSELTARTYGVGTPAVYRDAVVTSTVRFCRRFVGVTTTQVRLISFTETVTVPGTGGTPPPTDDDDDEPGGGVDDNEGTRGAPQGPMGGEVDPDDEDDETTTTTTTTTDRGWTTEQSEAAKAAEALAAARRSLSTALRTLANAQADLRIAETKRDVAAGLINTLPGQITSQIATVQAATNAIPPLSRAVTFFEGLVDAWNLELARLRVGPDANSQSVLERIRFIHREISRVNATLRTERADLANARSTLSREQSVLAGLRTTLTNARTNHAEALTEVTTANSRVSTANSAVTQARRRVANAFARYQRFNF